MSYEPFGIALWLSVADVGLHFVPAAPGNRRVRTFRNRLVRDYSHQLIGVFARGGLGDFGSYARSPFLLLHPVNSVERITPTSTRVNTFSKTVFCGTSSHSTQPATWIRKLVSVSTDGRAASWTKNFFLAQVLLQPVLLCNRMLRQSLMLQERSTRMSITWISADSSTEACRSGVAGTSASKWMNGRSRIAFSVRRNESDCQ